LKSEAQLDGWINIFKQDRVIYLSLFIFFSSLYIFTSSGNSVFDSDASIARYELTKSIAERLDFSIPSGYGVRGPDGRDYSWFGLGYSLFSLPFYYIGKLSGSNPGSAVSLINHLVGAAAVILIFRFLMVLGYSRRTSLLVSMFYGIGTIAWPIEKQPFDHTLETFLVLFSVYWIYQFHSNCKTSRLIYSSAFLGFAFLVRPTSILAVASIAIFIVLHNLKLSETRKPFPSMIKDIGLFFITFLPFLAIFFLYDYIRFGSIFETGYTLIANRLGIDFFSGTPMPAGLYGFLLSPGKGYFYYSPVAVLFFFGINSFRKKNPELSACFISMILFYLLFLSKNIFWHGDWAWGPRYLMVLTPFIIIPSAEIINSSNWQKSAILRKGVFTLFVLSVFIQISAVSVNSGKYFVYLHDVKKVKFILAAKDGAPPICEPEPRTYFNWHNSPIIAQIGFIYEIGKKLVNHDLKLLSHKQLDYKEIINKRMNSYDFWWLYQYSSTGSRFVIIIASVLLFVLTASLIRIIDITIKSGI
jgi:hypothetical protein